MPRVVRAHLVPGGEHLPAAPTRKFSRLMDVLEMSLHGSFVPEPLPALRTGDSVIWIGRNPDAGSLLSRRLSFRLNRDLDSFTTLAQEVLTLA